MRCGAVCMRVVLVCAVSCSVVLARSSRHHPSHPAGERSANPAGERSANPAENSAHFWYEEAWRGIAALERRGVPTHQRAKNVIMFLGDGMSFPTLAAARTLQGQRQGRTGEEEALFFEDFPTLGVSKTYCVDAQVADSACTATAYLCGVKNNEATLGVTAAVRRRNCNAALDNSTHVESIAEWALADERDAGFVTTTRVTHASPAGLYAKTSERYWENDADVVEDGYDPHTCRDIAHLLVHRYPGTHLKVILGGGRREFRTNETLDEEGSRGFRTDGRDLVEEWKADKEARGLHYRYVWNRDELFKAAAEEPDYLLGLFEAGHMQYHLEADPSTEPTLAELTEIAIKSLSRNEKGYFLFVEGGRIDHAHHDNLVEKALDETIELAKAVERALHLVSEEDTLVVVTADHSHAFSMNGYSVRGNPILGQSFWHLGDDGVPYMTLSYTNGPGARPHHNGVRSDFTKEANFMDINWESHAEIPRESETHGGDDVAVFAWGVQHGMFSGLYEQSRLAHLMAYAACLGPGPTAPACSAAATLTTTLVLLAAALLTALMNNFLT